MEIVPTINTTSKFDKDPSLPTPPPRQTLLPSSLLLCVEFPRPFLALRHPEVPHLPEFLQNIIRNQLRTLAMIVFALRTTDRLVSPTIPHKSQLLPFLFLFDSISVVDRGFLLSFRHGVGEQAE